eukprot:755602-Hanusia_phi.AAC.5
MQEVVNQIQSGAPINDLTNTFQSNQPANRLSAADAEWDGDQEAEEEEYDYEDHSWSREKHAIEKEFKTIKFEAWTKRKQAWSPLSKDTLKLCPRCSAPEASPAGFAADAENFKPSSHLDFEPTSTSLPDSASSLRRNRLLDDSSRAKRGWLRSSAAEGR